MEDLRSWFEVPAIAHFFHIFKSSFDLIEFEIEDFEEALFLDSAENVSSFLPDLVIQLLRGLYKTKDGLQVMVENYNTYLQDLLEYRYVTVANKLNPVANTTFKALPTRQKVEILFDMCNWRLELQDAMELTKDLESEEMRVMPVGNDAEGYQYWYFYGTRLYKEKCCIVDVEDENCTASENEEVPKPKPKKRRGKKRKITTTKSGRAVKQRRDFDSKSENAMSEDEEDSESEKTEMKIVELDEKPVLKPHENNEWSLICTTVEEWFGMVEKYKDTKDKNEKALLKGLKELNEIMPDLFLEKEKALQRKLLAMAPRRSSDRILVKMQVREDEERRKEQKRLFKNEMKVKEAEKKQKELQLEKEKEREKRYLERERNLEMRALRAKQREELKLVAENPELAKEMQLANKKNYSSVKFELEGEEDDKYLAMDKVLEVIKDHDDAWPFLEPVDEEEAPHYYEYIEKPIDLSSVTSKVKNKEYKDKSEFEEDMHLMFENCEIYNGTFSPFTKLAYKIRKVFDKQMKKEFPPEKDNTDELYEESENKSKLNTPKMKIPKEAYVKAPREKKFKEPNPLQAFKRNNAILTPEFAHAQILQAQEQLLHKTQAQSTNQGSPQILPKLGIPQDVLAQLSPAQMQSLIMQLRSGTFSTQKGPGSFSGFGIAPKIVASAAHQFSTGSKQLNLIMPSSGSRPIPRLEPKSLTLMSQGLSSPKNLSNLKITTPATVLQLKSGFKSVHYITTPNGPVRNLVMNNPPNKLPISPNNSSSKSTNIASVLLQKPISSVQTIGKSQPSNSTPRHNIGSINTAKPTAIRQSSPFSAPLLIQGKNTKEILRKLDSPVLGQGNVRYIGQPDGQLQKIVYLQTPKSVTSQQTLQQPPIRAAVFPKSTLNNRSSGVLQSPRQIVPIYLTPKGVPLQVVRPGISGVLATTSVKVLSGSKIPVNTTTSPVLIKPSTSAPIGLSQLNTQNLQGLKKAVQQVAAVTNINARLQNHLENKNPPTASQATPKMDNKVIINSLNNDKKLLNSPIALKVPVTLQSGYVLSSSPTVPKLIATTTNATAGIVLSPIRSVSRSDQQQGCKGVLPGAKQSNVSFILTSSGLVSVSLPTNLVPQMAVVNGTNLPSTQNIITSRIPSVFTAQPKPQLIPTGSTAAAKVNIAAAPQVVKLNTTLSSSSLTAPQVVKLNTYLPSSSLTAPQVVTVNTTLPSSNHTAPQVVNITTTLPSLNHTAPHVSRLNTASPSSNHTTPITKSVITPEKLRDAEALLGLINPTHLKPVSSSPVDRSKENTILTTNRISNTVSNNTSFGVATLLSNGGNPHKSSHVPDTVFSTKPKPHQKSIITSPPATNSVKIQLPSVNQPLQAANDGTVINGTGVPGPKMIVDAAQLLKLREEGKLMVTPNGQMFLLANNVLPPKSR